MRPTNCDNPAMDQIYMRSPMSSGSKGHSTATTTTVVDDDDNDNNNDDDPTAPKFTLDP